jgi:hypothetical protein
MANANHRDPVQPRKVMVVLTEAEWRAVRIAAASHDTTIQAYMSSAILHRLQHDDRDALDAATKATGERKARRPGARARA